MANLVNIGKYNMTASQKETLIGLQMAEVDSLDALSPDEFGTFPGFGEAYVGYVKKLRDIFVDDKTDLLQEMTYTPRPDSFHPIDTGQVAVELTLILNSTCARWLEGLTPRLPGMFPGQPERHNLSAVVAPILLDIMRNDQNRHKDMGTVQGAEAVAKLRP